MRKAALAALVVFPFLLASCAITPKPVVRYRTDGPGDLWNNGLQLHPADTRPFDFTTAFLELSRQPVQGYTGPRPLTFLVSACNRSDSALLLDPVDFRIGIPGKDSVLAAIDPEAVIHQARRDGAAEEARHSTEQGISALFTLPILVAEMATAFTPRTEEEEEQRRKDREERRRMEAESEEHHAKNMAEAASREALWSEYALRKTTLFPGMRTQGKVSFAVDLYARTPDTLLLQYWTGEGRLLDLGLYTIVRDTPPNRKAPEPKVAQKPKASPKPRNPYDFRLPPY